MLHFNIKVHDQYLNSLFGEITELQIDQHKITVLMSCNNMHINRCSNLKIMPLHYIHPHISSNPNMYCVDHIQLQPFNKSWELSH